MLIQRLKHHTFLSTTVPKRAYKNSFTPATIKSITDADSSTPVKLVKILPEKPMPYLPGQWLDFDPLTPNGRLLGLSLINFDHTCLEVAVKISPHTTVQWIHQELSLASKVAVQIGDDKTLTISKQVLDAQKESGIVLIAGGIGINPFLGMLDFVEKEMENSCKITLINVVKSAEENLFAERLKSYEGRISELDVSTFYSHGKKTIPEGCIKKLKQVRMQTEKSPRTYLCGPGGMMQQFTDFLLSEGFDAPITEKWATLAFDLHNKQS